MAIGVPLRNPFGVPALLPKKKKKKEEEKPEAPLPEPPPSPLEPTITANMAKAGINEGVDVRTGEIVDIPQQQRMAAPIITPEMEQSFIQQRAENLLSDIQAPISLLQPSIRPAGFKEVAGEVAAKAGAAVGGGLLGGGISAGGAALAGGAAAGGLTVGAGVLAVGAVIAANSIIAEIKEERIMQTKAQRASYADAITRIQKLMRAAKSGNQIAAIQEYRAEKAHIYQIESNLKMLDEAMWTRAQLGLVDIENFRRMERDLDIMFAQALAQNPDLDVESSFPIALSSGETE